MSAVRKTARKRSRARWKKERKLEPKNNGRKKICHRAGVESLSRWQWIKFSRNNMSVRFINNNGTARRLSHALVSWAHRVIFLRNNFIFIIKKWEGKEKEKKERILHRGFSVCGKTNLLGANREIYAKWKKKNRRCIIKIVYIRKEKNTGSISRSHWNDSPDATMIG